MNTGLGIKPELRVAVLGCGQIADAHLEQIAQVAGAQVVAVCDVNADVAFQAAARFGIKNVYSGLSAMLNESRPDVVHITIPAHVRGAAVRACLEAGAHVYVEKPVAMTEVELKSLYESAGAHGRYLCAGHDQLFDPAWEECRSLVRSGAIGEVVHVEAVQGYDMAGPYGQSIQRDPSHWVRALPGGLFQNVMSHAVARICDLATEEFYHVSATWSVRYTNLAEVPTELRVNCTSANASASLVFTSAARPLRRTATVYGTKATLEVDMDARTVRSLRSTKCPTALLKLYLPGVQVRDASRALLRNLRLARKGKLAYFIGMRTLFTAFYAAVGEGAVMPVTPDEALRVTRLMDRVIAQCRAEEQRRRGCTEFGGSRQDVSENVGVR